MSSTQIKDNHYSFLEPSERTWAIFLISLLSLFLEMLLIRWISTEIRIFAYLQNTILVACFLGLGIGYFTSHHQIIIRQSLVSLTFLLILMVIPVSKATLGRTSELLSVLNDMVIWGEIWHASSKYITIISVILGLALTYSILIVIVDIFVPIGRLLARLMDEHPNTLRAYSVNIAGSLVGTWIFVLGCSLYQPPFTWFVILGSIVLVFIILYKHDIKWNTLLISAIIALSWFAGLVPGAIDTIWSPYQKLVVEEVTQDWIGKYLVTVNNAGYQVMIDLSDTNTLSNPDKFSSDIQGLSQYDIPLLLHPSPKTYLIVGAGAGNDAAGAIRHGVSEITAVEIDPAIIAIGRNFHPEQPYSSPNVQVVIDDARSFFAASSEKYDVISFGLLDSHTATSMTNARLDHYVYTRESITRAKDLLADGGIMILTFEARKFYIIDRIASVLRETFGEEPMVIRIPLSEYGWGGMMFVSGDLESVKRQIAQNGRLGTYLNMLQQAYQTKIPYTTKIATDDWPYIYLATPEIPLLYYLLAGLMLVVFIRTIKKWKAPQFLTRWHRSHWHFFLLGAAFLLLEVQNISKASVVLGNTWKTNAVIVSGVLVMLLLANIIAQKYPKLPIGPVYFILITISLLLYFVDLAQFAFLPYISRIIIVGGLTSLPMLFSGIIFAKSFTVVVGKDEALGANIVGSLIGALLQSVTFLIGIKALLFIVAGMYTVSILTRPSNPS